MKPRPTPKHAEMIPPEAEVWPQPEHPLYVVGDIHGHADLLDRLLDRIARDRADKGYSPQADLIFVGDYIDRGPDSRGVIERVMRLSAVPGTHVTCLGGNHEDMCLSFLDGEGEDGKIWLANGGIETLSSYGVSRPVRLADEAAVTALRDLARGAIPQTHLDWIRARPNFWTSGDVVVVHASIDPDLPLEAQSRETLRWGRSPAFLKTRRDSGPWVVHGHTIIKPLAVHGRRIPVDGGAFVHYVLAAAVLEPGRPIRYLTTTD